MSADDEPIIEIESGDTVTLECITGWPETTPQSDQGAVVHELVREINASDRERLAPHLLTGPVVIKGAVPGDILRVDIEAIELGFNWGFCSTRPDRGTLPSEFGEHSIDHIKIDQQARTALMPYGLTIPLAPFFGVMATAPHRKYGRVSSREPREYGGNMDNKDLVAGTTLFLPVWTAGAKFYAGDGHAAQGDGEVCINGLETGLNGTFTFTVMPGDRRAYPRAETKSHFISMGFDSDLDRAMEKALDEMIAIICARSALTREEAYRLCSLVADFAVTQNVNGEKGVHGKLERRVINDLASLAAASRII